MKFLAIIEATIREGLAKKTILGMFIVSLVAIVIAFFIFQMDAVQKGLLTPANDKMHTQNGQVMNLMGVTVLDFVWMVTASILLLNSVFIGTFATAGFITSMMEKGSIDLLLSKPVPRWQYVVGRYCGAVLIIGAEVFFMILGLWFVAGISIGVWSPLFFLSALYITITFAGVYALVTLIGVLTRSSWFAIIIGLALFILASVIVPIFMFLDRLLTGDDSTGVLATVGKIMHYTIPQANEMSGTMRDTLLHQPINTVPIFLTIGLAIVYLGLSAYAFSKKEF